MAFDNNKIRKKTDQLVESEVVRFISFILYMLMYIRGGQGSHSIK